MENSENKRWERVKRNTFALLVPVLVAAGYCLLFGRQDEELFMKMIAGGSICLVSIAVIQLHYFFGRK